MENEDTTMEEVTHNEAPLTSEVVAEAAEPVEIKVKKKRTSRTWLITVNNGTEEYVATIKGVTSAEAAVAQFESTKAENEVVVSVRPARAFK